MDFEDLINENCCACGRIINDHGGHLNCVMLDRLAQWKYPSAGNVITGEKGKAVAIVCDECINKQRHIKYAIHYSDNKVAYVLIHDLEVFP